MNVELFKPHALQQKIIEEFVITPPLDKVWSDEHQIDQNRCQWCVVSVGRQFGKSLLAMNSILYWLLSDNNSLGVWTTPYDRQGDAVFDELTHASSKFIQTKNSQAKKVVFKNGSTLLFRSLENYESMRGYTFDYAVVDECAFVREEAWKVFRPTMAVNGKKCLVISTPWVKNTFYKMFQLGMDPDRDDFLAYTAPSTASPYFPVAELESAKDIMTKDQIRMEYYAEFGESGGGVFDGFADHCTVDAFSGDYRDERCYIGVDIALGGNDHTAVVIMNQSGRIINVERWQDGNTSRQIARLEAVIASYDIAGGLIEMNQERGIAQAINKNHPLIKPWMTKRSNKPEIIQNLKKDIEEGQIGLPTRKCCAPMFLELGDFTKEEKSGGYIKYSHPSGGNDDTVIALALANEARNPNRYKKFKPMIGGRLNSLATRRF